MQDRRVKLINHVGILALGLSLLAILGGILHLTVPVAPLADNIIGLFFLLALAALNLLVYVIDRTVDSGAYPGRRLHRRGYLWLAAMMGGLSALALLNLLVALLYTNRFDRFIFGGIYFIYFGLPVLGSLVALESLAVVRAGFPLRRGGRAGGGGFKRTIAALCLIVLVAGTLGIYFFLAGDRSIFFESAPQFVEIFLSGFSLFHAFILLSISILILKLQNRPGSAGAVFAGILGLACFIIYLLPLLTISRTCAGAEAEFIGAFGSDMPGQIDPAWEDHFLSAPFSIPAYFLGVPPGDYRYEKSVPFYEGDSGVDEGLRLYFDVFMPPEGRGDLPGRGTALIRIHGGAWIGGDKGFANMMQVNKHFAAQGYTVFDVQYGLTNLVKLTALQPYLAPPGLIGPYTLDDMVRHLGIFTGYLADHAYEYDLHLDSVFVSGGSAGGQLAAAVALALAGGRHPGLFSDQITIKGCLPLYPALHTSFLPAIGRAAEWIDVELLLEGKSPPCLIYQGEKDGMVNFKRAAGFRELYQAAENERCAVLKFNWAGHASDFYFPGLFNQVWIYHMERFMALYR